MGGGFLINRDGYVATNFHVMEDCEMAEAEFRDGERVRISGYRAFDAKRDIAIVQIETVPHGAVPLELASRLDVKQGASVVAMGHPRGLRFTATEGIVNAIQKTSDLPADIRSDLKSPDDQIWIQSSAKMFPGSSGGPLLSRSGKVVGINSWITVDIDFGFALAVQHLTELASQAGSEVLELAEVNRKNRGENDLFDPQVEAIHKDYVRNYEEFRRRLKAAKSEAEVEKLLVSENPARRDVPRLLKIASENPKTSTAFEAMFVALVLLSDYYPQSSAIAPLHQVTSQLLRDHLEDDAFDIAVELVGDFDLTPAKNFLTEVINRSPDKETQGIACLLLARLLIASEKPGPKVEGIRLLERVINEFSDVVLRDKPIVKEAERVLFAERHLAIGVKAPEIIGRDVAGNEFKLSDHRGKVVMLSFFANWSSHCTSMYRNERRMVELQQGRPYVLLGVNCDPESVLDRLVATEIVTWRCWADGVGGPIFTEWQVDELPMIYLIDHQGIIRHKFDEVPDSEDIDRALAQMVGKVRGGR
ncbi:trypsin-like peptidase domain-containing protein [Schlesneria sp. DSM 10557]|uniref:trypsin-like peptidase domain-containing protein n=1 Tax=Schlesneria sp. DSM 10557 TaxID=3044399 RepID=UPI00359FB5F8